MEIWRSPGSSDELAVRRPVGLIIAAVDGSQPCFQMAESAARSMEDSLALGFMKANAISKERSPSDLSDLLLLVVQLSGSSHHHVDPHLQTPKLSAFFVAPFTDSLITDNAHFDFRKAFANMAFNISQDMVTRGKEVFCHLGLAVKTKQKQVCLFLSSGWSANTPFSVLYRFLIRRFPYSIDSWCGGGTCFRSKRHRARLKVACRLGQSDKLPSRL
jgi:hypothetical protein